MKFYTDPTYFFELWCHEMQKDTEMQKKELKQRRRNKVSRHCNSSVPSHLSTTTTTTTTNADSAVNMVTRFTYYTKGEICHRRTYIVLYHAAMPSRGLPQSVQFITRGLGERHQGAACNENFGRNELHLKQMFLRPLVYLIVLLLLRNINVFKQK